MTTATSTPTASEDRLGYSIKETAGLIGRNYHTVLRLIDRGLIRPSRALRTPIIPRAEIERFLRDTSK